MIASGSVRLGISVATALRRKKKITSDHEHQRDDQRLLHVGDRVADRDRPVVLRRETFSVGGSPGLISSSSSFTRSRDLHRVRARLALHEQIDRALAVVPADAILLFWMSSRTFATSPSRTARAVVIRDDQSRNSVRVRHLAGRLHRQRLVLSVQHAGRQHDVVLADRVRDLRHADVARRELRRIELHAHRVLRRAEHVDRRHAFDHREPLRDRRLARTRRPASSAGRSTSARSSGSATRSDSSCDSSAAGSSTAGTAASCRSPRSRPAPPPRCRGRARTAA